MCWVGTIIVLLVGGRGGAVPALEGIVRKQLSERQLALARAVGAHGRHVGSGLRQGQRSSV